MVVPTRTFDLKTSKPDLPTLIVSVPVLKGRGVRWPIHSWMDIDAYNLPSKYTRKLLPMLSIVVEEPLVITYKL